MSEIIKIDQLNADLESEGFNMDEELDRIETNGSGFELPRIRIEHKDSTNKHYFYVDHGDDYIGTPEEKIGDTVQGVVFSYQFIRALWQEEEALPVCSSVDNKPAPENPISANCLGCSEAIIGKGTCKPKVRLWLLISGKPYILHLSPTSLKFWNSHIKKLKRSSLPVVAVNTVFSLKPIKRNGFSYAEVEVGINGIVSRENLKVAKEYRDALDKIMVQISDNDFQEKGDKV